METFWSPAAEAPLFAAAEIGAAAARYRERCFVLTDPATGAMGLGFGGTPSRSAGRGTWPVRAVLPEIFPEWLGDRAFTEAHRVRFPYVVGAMAQGIASVDLVSAAAEHGLLGFLGTAGLGPEELEAQIDALARRLGERTWGVDLMAGGDAAWEMRQAELYVARSVPRISAVGFLEPTAALARLAWAGARRDEGGRVVRARRLVAKLSRAEPAARFLRPAAAPLVGDLVARRLLSREEAALAERLPLVEDVAVEADSGGHTDRRPASVVFPTVLRTATEAARTAAEPFHPRVGLGGGVGTPAAVASAFAAGAAFVLTGSVNQPTVEAGQSGMAKQLLAEADVGDMAMAPAADTFELGGEVQVLRRGTLFAARARWLQDLHERYAGLEALPAADRERLEREILGKPVEEVWAEVVRFFEARDPAQLEAAASDARRRMALVFRWYLGQASRWAIRGEAGRRTDFQIWCGPALGSFNRWVKGSFLEPLPARGVGAVALSLLHGAAVVCRAQQFRAAGLPVPPEAFDPPPVQVNLVHGER